MMLFGSLILNDFQFLPPPSSFKRQLDFSIWAGLFKTAAIKNILNQNSKIMVTKLTTCFSIQGRVGSTSS